MQIVSALSEIVQTSNLEAVENLVQGSYWQDSTENHQINFFSHMASPSYNTAFTGEGHQC